MYPPSQSPAGPDWKPFTITLAAVITLTMASPAPTAAQPGWVLSHQKISDSAGNFSGALDDNDRLGIQIANIGDLDGDGVIDIAVGAVLDDDGGTDRGAVWIMFLNSDGTVKSHQKISDTRGGFTGTLVDYDRFGRVASLGDLDQDGVVDLAVGAHTDDDGGTDRGAVWILFLNADGTVKAHQKISAAQGGFTGVLDDGDGFGWSVTCLRDVDGDRVPELAVGAIYDDDGTTDAGAVWILFLDRDGTVKAHQKISATSGGFADSLAASDEFGHAVAPLHGDLDRDGVPDLAVGAFRNGGGGVQRGAVWILFLNADGTVKAHQKISSDGTDGSGFTGVVDDNDHFTRVVSLPDIDGDQIQDLAVGATGDDDGPFTNHGAVWILFLDRDGTVKGHQKISATQGGFGGTLDTDDLFGWAGTWLGDLNGDGRSDLAVTALWDDDGGGPTGYDRGAVWVLTLDGAIKTGAPDVARPSIVSLITRPNPFRGRTTLEYALPTAGPVRLRVVDARGAHVATLVDRVQATGPHAATWAARTDLGAPAAAGIYFARLETAYGTTARKVVVVR